MAYVKKEPTGYKGIYKRGEKYYARAFVGRNSQGKAVYEEKTFAKLSAARNFMSKIRIAKQEGTYVKPSKEFLANFCEIFLAEKEYQVRPGTFRKYNWLIRKYVIPEIGEKELRKLTGQDLQDLYSRLLMAPYGPKKRGLSPRSVKHLHVLIKQLLKVACKKGKLVVNVADNATPPKVEKQEMMTWKEYEFTHFLDVARNSRHFLFFALALSTGMRAGEILGLMWRDINWETGTIHIQRSYTHGKKGYLLQPTKTKRANRTIKLAASTLAALKAHFLFQQTERTKAGEMWEDNDFIIATNTGRPILPHNIRTSFYRYTKKARLNRIRIHDLRHTHATFLLSKGVNVKVVSERLGHESIQVTLDLYSHVLESMQDEAAEKIDLALAVTTVHPINLQNPYGQHMGNIL